MLFYGHERLLEVVDDVLVVLGADGQTDCAFEDALVGGLFPAQFGVRGGERMDDEALHVGHVSE